MPEVTHLRKLLQAENLQQHFITCFQLVNTSCNKNAMYVCIQKMQL